MISQLIQFSLSYRTLVLGAATALLALGAYTASTMPVDVFPDLTAPTVTILTEAHGMAPTEVETLVSFPLETAMRGAAGVRRVRSSSTVGFSIVWVEFDWGTDPITARQIVNEKLSLASAALPDNVDSPFLAPQASIMGEVMIVALRSVPADKHSLFELRTLADTTLRRRLLSVPGVAQVTPIGGEKKQYQVILDRQKLYAYDISAEEVARAVARTNENASGGILAEGGREFLIQGVGRIRRLEQIAGTVVAVRNDIPIKVEHLVSDEVQIGPALKRGVGSAQGQPAVVIAITKQPNVNTLELTEQLNQTLDEIQETIPEGIKIERRIFRQSDFIENSIGNVQRALRDGGILVVIIVLLFLGNVRASVITLTAIPLSLISAILVLHAWGATINTMTLGGMAIAIGELVDDAIVDVENIFRRLRQNAKLPKEQQRNAFVIIYKASVEIRSSIVFATMIVVLVFVPLFFLPGIEGRMLRPLGVAYIVSMAASLLVAVTVTPAMCYFLLPRSRAIQKEHEPPLPRLCKSVYRPILNRVLDRPWLVGGVAVAMLGLAALYVPFMGQSFLPEFNEGALTITAGTLPGTSLEQSSQLGGEVERIMMKHPEIVAVARQTGRAELAEHTQGVESSELTATLDMSKSDRTTEELLSELREELALIPGTIIEIGQPISHRIDHMLSGTRAAIAINIFAPESDTASLPRLRQLAERIEHEIGAIPGVVDLAVEQQMHVPVMQVSFDRHEIARHKLRVKDVALELERAFSGETVSQVLEGRNPFDLVVRLSKPGEIRREDIHRLPVSTPAGAKIPLGALAEIREDRGPNMISRENVQRKIVVSCNVADRDIGSVIGDIQTAIDERIPLGEGQYSGYYVEYGGQFESAQSSFRLLLWLGIGVVICIGLLLHIAFHSIRDALLVLLNLPLALIGGVLGVFMSGGVLSIASLVGFITLLGIATRNGIMLVSHIRHLQREEGVTEFREAVHRGAIERVSPILMTALSTGLGLLPLALAGGHPGSEIETPLAIVVLFGLFSSTILNMIVVPALFLRFASPTPPETQDVKQASALHEESTLSAV